MTKFIRIKNINFFTKIIKKIIVYRHGHQAHRQYYVKYSCLYPHNINYIIYLSTALDPV